MARGHSVTMVCGSAGMGRTGLMGQFDRGVRRGSVDGIDVTELDLPYSNHDSFLRRTWIFSIFAIRSSIIALQEDYDLLFATSTPLTAGIPGIVARIFRKKPFVFEVRDLWPEFPKAMGVINNPIALLLLEWLETLSYRAADGCIGLSPGIVKGIVKKGKEKGKVAMVPNGCDLELFNPDTLEAKRPDGIPPDSLVAVFTGAHGIANGLETILRAVELLKQRGNETVKFVFIGDGKLKPELKQLAAGKKLDNCLFLDPVPKVELAEYLRGADLGLMILANVPAFYYGTSPNKFFDYISAGLPVLNNYPGWLADLIRKYKCGIAVPPESPEAFADALIYLADYPDRRKKMGKSARKLAEQIFAREELARQFADFLEKIKMEKSG